jgi:hypothetical protein
MTDERSVDFTRGPERSLESPGFNAIRTAIYFSAAYCEATTDQNSETFVTQEATTDLESQIFFAERHILNESWGSRITTGGIAEFVGVEPSSHCTRDI